MEKVRKFLEEFQKSPQAAELFSGEKPLSADEFVKRLAGAAQKMGVDVSEAELKDYFDSMQKKVLEKTDSVAARIAAESDDVLDEVAGGEEDTNGDSKNCGAASLVYCATYVFDWRP